VDQTEQPLPGSFALYRFDPWKSRFDTADVDLGFNQTLTQSRLVATGPDAFVWLAADAEGPVTRGVRLGTRSAFVSDVELVSLRDAEDLTRPAHLTPDHPPDDDVSYDSKLGALQLSKLAATSLKCVWVSDAEYGDFSAQIAFSSSTPPALRLGTRTIAGSGSANSNSPCQLPAPASSAGSSGSLTLQRKGKHIAIRVSVTSADMKSVEAKSSSCELDAIESAARVPFGVCQSELDRVTVTRLSITRGG